MFRTSDGISFKPMAAMFSLPLVLATATRDWSTFEVEFASRFRLNGSSARPKSNVLSVGMTGATDASSIEEASRCTGAATRLAAFALAICSRSAADAFLNCGGESEVAAVCADVEDAAEKIKSSPEVVVEDFWDARESFRGVPTGVVVLLIAGAGGFFNRPFRDGLGCSGRVDSVFDPMGDEMSSFGFSGLGVLARGTRTLDGDAILDRTLAFSPTLEGVRNRVLGARPRPGELSMEGNCDLKGLLVDASCPGPELEPGLLRDGRAVAGLEHLDAGLSPHLLDGRDADPSGSVSKKLEMDALVLRAGVEGRCANVSMVLSAKDGRVLGAFPRFISSPSTSPSTGLLCEYELLEAPALDNFVILGVRFLVSVACETHCDEGLFLSPGSLVEGCWSRGESCSGRVAIGSRGSRDEPLVFVALGSFGRELEVGRLEIGRDLGSVFAVFEVVAAGFIVAAAAAGRFVMLLMSKLVPVARRSLEAAGRRRLLLASIGTPPCPAPIFSARLSFDGDGRSEGVLGMGRRDMGRGRPLDLPAGTLFSSIIPVADLFRGPLS